MVVSLIYTSVMYYKKHLLASYRGGNDYNAGNHMLSHGLVHQEVERSGQREHEHQGDVAHGNTRSRVLF